MGFGTSMRIVAAAAVITLQSPGARAQADPPAMSPTQIIGANQLTPDEADFYRTLDPAAQQDFLITRSWYRLCRAVVEHRLAIAKLPDKPAQFKAKYLQPTDVNYINRAITMQVSGDVEFREMTAAQILDPASFTPAEQTVWNGIADPVRRKQFIMTRSYLRLCQQVLDHATPAADLPDKPLDFVSAYVSPAERTQIDQAVQAAILADIPGDSDKSK